MTLLVYIPSSVNVKALVVPPSVFDKVAQNVDGKRPRTVNNRNIRSLAYQPRGCRLTTDFSRVVEGGWKFYRQAPRNIAQKFQSVSHKRNAHANSDKRRRMVDVFLQVFRYCSSFEAFPWEEGSYSGVRWTHSVVQHSKILRASLRFRETRDLPNCHETESNLCYLLHLLVEIHLCGDHSLHLDHCVELDGYGEDLQIHKLSEEVPISEHCQKHNTIAF